MPFQSILARLVEAHVSFARAAIFCDEEGERVQAFAVPGIDPWDVDLLGAAYAPLAARLEPHTCLRVVHKERVVWCAAVERGYYVVVLCERGPDGVIRRVLPTTVAALAAQM